MGKIERFVKNKKFFILKDPSFAGNPKILIIYLLLNLNVTSFSYSPEIYLQLIHNCLNMFDIQTVK